MNKPIIPTIKKRITVFSGLFFLTGLFSGTAFSANIYVDSTIGSNITNGTYSAANRNASGSDGNAYRTIQDALNAMSGMDDIYIRQGTYREGSITIPLGRDGIATDYSSIQSYPGEWAVLDGSGGSESYVIGFTCYDKDGKNQHQYWRFERLEIRNGVNEGLFVSGGPFIVRYNYIHDNISGSGGANPGGIKGMIWHDSLIEYNLFEDNGTTGSPSGNGNHIGIHSDYAFSHGHDWRYLGVYDPNNCTRKNEIRYNLFIDNDDVAHAAYRHKAQQPFSPIVGGPNGDTGTTLTNPDMTYKDFGDKFHHNIVINDDVQMDQDFAQVYNNIIVNGELTGGWPRLFSAVKATFYNNTLIGGAGMVMEYNGFTAPYNPGNSPGETIPVWWYAYNNIISPSGQTAYNNAITIAGEGPNYVEIDMSRNDIQRNYVYNPSFSFRNNDTVMIGNDYDYPDRSMNIDRFNSLYGYTNWETTSGSNLFVGTSAADQYVTNGNHQLASGVTIANGGIGVIHPYLEGVTIPTYVGATDPNNSGWVEQVLSLDVACMTSDQCVSSQTNAPGIPKGFEITLTQ